MVLLPILILSNQEYDYKKDGILLEFLFLTFSDFLIKSFPSARR